MAIADRDSSTAPTVATLERQVARLQQQLAVETEKRQIAEARLAEALAKLREQQQEFQDFLYAASHDLQEPLRKITAFGNRLQVKFGHALGDRGGDYLQRMIAAAARMQGLIEGLLTLSRVTTKAQPFAPFNLDATLADAVGSLQRSVQAAGGRIERAPDCPPIVGDRAQIAQVLRELLDNAWKFRNPEIPFVLQISHQARGYFCEIRFADNGMGFDGVRHGDCIFAPFQRLQGRCCPGAGMGLAVCQRIVRRHGGTLTATAIPEAGATFTLLLPWQQPEREV